jgi:hypothetical protein
MFSKYINYILYSINNYQKYRIKNLVEKNIPFIDFLQKKLVKNLRGGNLTDDQMESAIDSVRNKRIPNFNPSIEELQKNINDINGIIVLLNTVATKIDDKNLNKLTVQLTEIITVLKKYIED